MRQALFATLLAPLVLAAAPVLAADLPRGSPPPPDYYSPRPVANWEGFYAGINGGIGFASFTDGADTLFANPTGGLIGFTAGYNHMVAPNLLIGLEGDFDFAGLRASQNPYFGFATQGSINDMATIRARVGYVMDRALVYVTGGFAGSNNTVSVNNVWGGAFYGERSIFQTGWALGAGVEFMLTPNLSAKAEYLFTSVGSDRYFDYSYNALQSAVNTSAVKVGVNYHF
ncbi:MAG: outer membrane beta-barrel protein [Methylocystis sp.]